MFMEDSESIKKNLEMRPSGRNGGCIMVLVDKSSKPPLLDGSGQYVKGNERVVCNGGCIMVLVDKSSKPPLLDGSGQYVKGNERVVCNGVEI